MLTESYNKVILLTAVAHMVQEKRKRKGGKGGKAGTKQNRRKRIRGGTMVACGRACVSIQTDCRWCAFLSPSVDFWAQNRGILIACCTATVSRTPRPRVHVV